MYGIALVLHAKKKKKVLHAALTERGQQVWVSNRSKLIKMQVSCRGRSAGSEWINDETGKRIMTSGVVLI